MKIFRQQLGLTMVELTVVLAISGLIAIPLTSIFGTQLRIPQKIASEINASSQIQKSTVPVVLEASGRTKVVPLLMLDPKRGNCLWPK